MFIIVIQLSLPPTDMAYGQNIFSRLSDPFVLSIALPIIVTSGLFASLVMFFFLQHHRLIIVLPIVFTSALVAVVLTTPLSQMLGLFSALDALVISSFLCSRMRITQHNNATDDQQKTGEQH